MSLTDTDLYDIRSIVRDQNTALENDIKEIYHILAKMNPEMITDPHFKKLSVKNKILVLNAELLSVAKQAGVALPRS